MSIQHLDVHVAAALDERGGLLGVETFTTTTAGYQRLLLWLQAFGEVDLVGVEGTGSYGAGLTRLLHADHIAVVEVDRPNRQRRRRCGKSGPRTRSALPARDSRVIRAVSPRPAPTSKPCESCVSLSARRAVHGLRR